MTFGENVPYPDAFVELVEKYADPWWESEFAHIGTYAFSYTILAYGVI